MPNSLSDGTIHIWDLNCRQVDITTALEVLSDDERQRHQRLLLNEKKVEFAVTRAALRLVLAQYLRCTPQSIEFTFNADGKPAVTNDQSSVFFNVSHSQQRSLIALAPHCCGVDIEAHRDIDLQRIGQRFFHPNEDLTIRSLETSQQIPAFFRCWSHKEAAMKCSGRGMRAISTGFEVAIGSQPRICSSNEYIMNQWDIRDIDVGADFSAAIVSVEKIDAVCMHRGTELFAHLSHD